jgi:hypothetical protein
LKKTSTWGIELNASFFLMILQSFPNVSGSKAILISGLKLLKALLIPFFSFHFF